MRLGATLIRKRGAIYSAPFGEQDGPPVRGQPRASFHVVHRPGVNSAAACDRRGMQGGEQPSGAHGGTFRTRRLRCGADRQRLQIGVRA